MDSSASGVGIKSSLIESGVIKQQADQAAHDQVTPTAANETRQLVAFAAEIRGATSAAFSSPSKSPVNPGALATELLRRLDPFLQKAHAYGRVAALDDLVASLPTPPTAGAGVALANLNPADLHPGPARKSFAQVVPDIEGGIQGPVPERAFNGAIEPFYDSVIANLFGSDESFRQWSNDTIGEIFKGKVFQVELAMVGRGVRGVTDWINTLTRQA
jgi:hypothetical protein